MPVEVFMSSPVVWLAVAAIACSCLSGCRGTEPHAPAPDLDAATDRTPREAPPEPPLRAWRYPVLIVDSVEQAAAGDGRWVDTIYIPRHGVVARVVGDPDPRFGDVWWPVFYAAFRSLSKDRGANPKGESESDVAPVEIAVPADLANRIVRLAELTRERETLARELARQLPASGLVRPARPRISRP